MEVEAGESTLSPKLGDVEAQRVRRQRRRQRANTRVHTSVTGQITAPAETPVSAAQLEARLLDVSSAAGKLSESDGVEGLATEATRIAQPGHERK